ncbi:MAG: hypothetical protein V3V24_09685 [Nitrospinaceae bacterium]
MEPEWRIYYEDRTRDYTEGLPDTMEDRHGVLVIAQRRLDGHYHTIYGSEYYLFEGRFWFGVNLNGLEDWTINMLPRVKLVIKARGVPHGFYNDIFQTAKEATRKGSLG